MYVCISVCVESRMIESVFLTVDSGKKKKSKEIYLNHCFSNYIVNHQTGD